MQHVYPKLDEMAVHYAREQDVDTAFLHPAQADLSGQNPNQRAHSAVLNWFAEQALRKALVTVATALEQFAQPPFGWAELDTLGLLAELVQAGKLELRQHQQRLKPEKGLAQRLLAKQGRKEVLLMLQQEIAPVLLKQARNLLDQEFALVSPPHDPERLFSAFSEQVRTQLATLEGYLRRSASHYPCHAALQATHARLQLLSRPQHYQDFFEVLGREAEALDGHGDQMADFESFFGGQIEVFDRNRAALQALATEVPHLHDATLRQNYAQAEAIMSAPAERLYRELQKVSFLLEPVQQAVTQLRQEKQAAVTQAIAQAEARLQALYAESAPAAGFAPVWEQALQPLRQLAHEVAQAVQIDTVLARELRVAVLETQASEALTRWLQQQAAAQVVADTPAAATPAKPVAPPAPVARPVAYVYPAQLDDHPLLESQADVERYIAKLKDQLLQTLAAGKRIQLR